MMMAKRQRALEIASKLPLADMLAALDHATDDALHMAHPMSHALGVECGCGQSHGGLRRWRVRREDELLAENARLRRALSDLASEKYSV